MLEAARDLVRREIDKGVERGAGDAEGDAGEAGGVERAGREPIERRLLAPLRLIVAGDRVVMGDDEIADAIGPPLAKDQLPLRR